MDVADALASLEKAGTEQNRKTYRRHGAPDPLFGVSFATQRALAKKIKVDHDLAVQLWASGNTDARTLALLIADPARLDADTAARWVTESRYDLLVDEAAGVVARSPLAMTCMAAWLGSDDEWLARAGWVVMARLAKQPSADVPDASFPPYIAMIERRIHDAPNRVREAMNLALIGIGSRSDELAEAAIAAARRIGPVVVDHGDTECKTPDAELYIAKTRGYRTTKAKSGAKVARAKAARMPAVRARPGKRNGAGKAKRDGASKTKRNGAKAARTKAKPRRGKRR